MSSSFALVGVPHSVTRDDIYKGFFIPKGRSCFLNKICFMFANPCILRRGGDRKYMVGYLYVLMEKFELFSRSILHDPARYPEPDVFKPERFLNPDGSLRDDPVLTSVFGFGRRICPGRHFADTALFISIASLFSVFNIERGGKGGDKLSDYTYAGGTMRYLFGRFLNASSLTVLPSFLDPFPCSFIPRDSKARELILADIMSS